MNCSQFNCYLNLCPLLDMKLNEWVEIIFYVLSLIVFFITYIQYRNSIKVRKSEVVANLYEKFYENEGIKYIRNWIDEDNNDAKKFQEKIKEADALEENGRYLKNFDYMVADYLNFFLLITNMVRLKQVEVEDVLNLNKYYLKQLYLSDYLNEYMKKYDYQVLLKFLNDNKDKIIK